MFQSDRILTLNIGASKLVLAEFSVARQAGLQLLRYGIGQFGADHENRADASAVTVSVIRDIMREQGIEPAPLLMTVSGQNVFPRFVKLPPVSADKVSQIVRYEAEQNVPFPMDEVVWDYQIIKTDDGEPSVMLVAVKVENIESLTNVVLAADMEPDVVDAAPMALYNAVRYNYPNLEGCTLLLDVGARSSNLIFIEDTRIFSRSIPVAGNSVTQELIKEFGVSFDEAEELKKTHGFVAFGGVYGGPDSEVADRVSKIVRNTVTRLHAEINRSINFYRSQQGGSSPSLLLLTGGSSVIPHMDTFFRERLKVDVEYFNPFVNVPVSADIDADRISGDLHLMGEVVGLSLRRWLTCPVEINLVPPELIRKKTMRKRQPFFALAAVGLVLIMLCWRIYVNKMEGVADARLKEIQTRIDEKNRVLGDLTRTLEEKQKLRADVDILSNVIERRSSWVQVIDGLHTCLLDGMWLTSVKPVIVGDMIPRVEISGHGFEDKMTKFDHSDATAVELFRDALRAHPAFASNTAIKTAPPVGAQAFARAFTIEVHLNRPIER